MKFIRQKYHHPGRFTFSEFLSFAGRKSVSIGRIKTIWKEHRGGFSRYIWHTYGGKFKMWERELRERS